MRMSSRRSAASVGTYSHCTVACQGARMVDPDTRSLRSLVRDDNQMPMVDPDTRSLRSLVRDDN
jgi:hypothetical protein